MSLAEAAAVVATTLLAALAFFQLLLAAGLPLGRAAWGGKHRVLPAKLRWGSLAAVPVLWLATWMVLARADLVAPGAEAAAVSVATWLFAGYFSLNTLGNIMSKSRTEQLVMTPVSTILVVCFVAVALS